jgi:hypothetical protein
MKWSDEDIQFLKLNFGKIKTREISLLLKRSYNAIRAKARILKLVCSREINRKYSINDNYFSVINNKNSYWAGFIAADGCITKKCVKIMLSIIDIELLKQFKNDISYTGPLYIDNKRKRCSIEFGSQKIINDLKCIWNIVEKKSLILNPPLGELNQINILSYIRGFLDGDGSIYTEKNSNYLRIQFVGTLKLLTWIKENLKLKSSITKYKNIHRLRYSGKNALEIYKKLFNLETFILKRKWKIKHIEA